MIHPPRLVVINLLIPFVIAIIFALAVANQHNMPPVVFSMVPYLFYGISLLIIWVSWHFNRNRFIFIILPLVLMYIGFGSFSGKNATSLFMYISILFPIHLLVFLILKERGIFSIWGILKIIFFLFEVGLVVYLIYYPSMLLQEFIHLKIFTASFFPLKDVSVIIGLLSLIVLAGLVAFNRYLVYNSSFLVMMISFYMGLYFLHTPNAIEVALLSISVIVFSILIRESYRLAFYDELTELPGRRALVEDMAKLGMKYSLAMIDIDFFKKFNDTYGHDTGDDVLKMVAAKLSGVTGGGKAYRYGGEEFVLLFPSVDVDSAYVHTDLLRELIAKTPFTVRNHKGLEKIFINISSGIVQNMQSDKTPFDTMKRADDMLYKAKKAGRNQVVKG